MRKKIFKVLQYVLFLGLGVFIFWYVYKDLDIDQLFIALKEVNYWWLSLALVFSLLSHYSRALRWRLLITPMGFKPSVGNSFFAVMILYVTNLLIPRAGEIARCSVLTRYEKIPFTKLLGTVVTERITDVFFMFILTLVVLALELGVIKQFFISNPEISNSFNSYASWDIFIVFIGILIFLAIIFYLLRKGMKNSVVYKKLAGLFRSFLEGIKTIRNLENFWLFIFYSFFIYLMYYITLYVTFLSFPPTSDLTPSAALVVFFMGTLAMLAPVQGGIGAYHFMIYQSLILYGVMQSDGKIFALIAHTSVNFLILIFGVLSLVILPIYNNRRKVSTAEEEGIKFPA